jgi:hypothetical protein
MTATKPTSTRKVREISEDDLNRMINDAVEAAFNLHQVREAKQTKSAMKKAVASIEDSKRLQYLQTLKSLIDQAPEITKTFVASYVQTVEMLEGVKLSNIERRLNMAKTFGVTLEPKQIVALLFPELDLSERANGGVIHATTRTGIRTEVDEDGTVVSSKDTVTDHYTVQEREPIDDEPVASKTRRGERPGSGMKHS